jgi:two-component system phosphate regulon sensor histidine kinase PhoR
VTRRGSPACPSSSSSSRAEFSRYELTREKLAFGAFDAQELARQVVVAMAPRFDERRLRVRVRAAPRTPLAWGDRGRVLQVIMNLLSNAERYCTEGGAVRIAAAPARDGRIAISVSDDGPGISPEHLERIFDRLYQVGDAVKEREKGAGLGLGLAIVKSIVEAHGGRIAVRSRVDHGTRFWFTLPSAQRAAVAEPPAERSGAASP